MTLAKIMAGSTLCAKNAKEMACKDGPKDINPEIHVFRAEELIAVVVPPQHQRDLILRCFRAAAVGFSADALGCVFETYLMASPVRQAMRHPVTGREIGQGDMQDLVMNHQAIEKGWVREALMVTAVNRAGDILSSSIPFTFTPSTFGAPRLQWAPEHEWTASGEAKGLMPKAMIGALQEKSMTQYLPFEQTDANRAQVDVYVGKNLHEHLGAAVILVGDERDPARAEVLRQAGVEL